MGLIVAIGDGFAVWYFLEAVCNAFSGAGGGSVSYCFRWACRGWTLISFRICFFFSFYFK